jgi:hypothetical protein
VLRRIFDIRFCFYVLVDQYYHCRLQKYNCSASNAVASKVSTRSHGVLEEEEEEDGGA